MIRGEIRRAGIVGGGVAGLAAAKTLTGEGIDCVVFERAPQVGGVWADGYVDFGVQVQKALYEFPDWPLPESAPDFTPGPVMQKYLEDYCDAFGIRDCLRLSTRVTEVARAEDGAGWRIRHERNGEAGEEVFDLVAIATGLYSETPHIPEFPGRADYRGRVLHVSELKTREPLEGRTVAVIGYGKSATDAAGEAVKVGKSAHLVFRDVHWPVPRKLAGLVPFKYGMLNRMTATVIPPYVRPSWVARQMHSIGKPLVWAYWRAVELLLRVQFRLDTKVANGKTLLPTKPVEFDCFGESTMVPRPGFIDHIRAGRIQAHRAGVARFRPDGLVLDDGEEIEADCVVFGTGWQSDHGCLSPEVRRVLGHDEDGFYLWRHMLHPDLENLVFLGRASTFLSIVTFSVQARWLAEAIAGRVAMPDRGAMLAEIEALKAWKRSWMPASSARSARVLLHMANYHDELLRDFGADPWRKKGVLAPLKEVFAPYQSRDFAEIAAGTFKRVRERA